MRIPASRSKWFQDACPRYKALKATVHMETVTAYNCAIRYRPQPFNSGTRHSASPQAALERMILRTAGKNGMAVGITRRTQATVTMATKLQALMKRPSRVDISE